MISNIQTKPTLGLLGLGEDLTLWVDDNNLKDDYPVTNKTGETAGSRFGHAIVFVDLNRDGKNDLVVSAPHYDSENLDYRGKCYIYFGGSTNVVTINVPYASAPNQFDRPNVPPGPRSGAYTNAGTTLAAYDIDMDGYKDLVIGSHYACSLEKLCGANDNLQCGLVSVFLSSTWTQISGPKSLLEANWMRYGDNRFDWFGYHINFLASQRVMIIGAPTSLDSTTAEVGKLYGFNMDDVKNGINTAVPIWTIVGSKQFDLVGFHTSIGQPYGTNVDYLTVSLIARDSTFPLLGTQLNQTGALLIIKAASLTGTRTIEYLKPNSAYITGLETYGRLGWFSTWSGDELWLSSTFVNNHGGRVDVYDTDFLGFPAIGKSKSVLLMTKSFCYQDTALVRTKGGRYGSNIILPSNGNTVKSITTAPRASYTGLLSTTQDSSGRAFVIYK